MRYFRDYPNLTRTIDLQSISRRNGLTQTCRQLRVETRAMFWALNRFGLEIVSNKNKKIRRKDIIVSRLQKLLRCTLGPDIVSHILQLRIHLHHVVPTPWHKVLTIDGIFDGRSPVISTLTLTSTPSAGRRDAPKPRKVKYKTDVQGSSSSNMQHIVGEYLDMGLDLHILEEHCTMMQTSWNVIDRNWAHEYVGSLAVFNGRRPSLGSIVEGEMYCRLLFAAWLANGCAQRHITRM